MSLLTSEMIDASVMSDVRQVGPPRSYSALCYSNDAEIELLQRVGNDWLRDCTRLTALDCTGLTALVTVGYNWLRHCTSLTALDCTGLT